MIARQPPERLPILVWQMGKVGSTSICHALWRAGIWHLQTHSMNPARLAALRGEFIERGLSIPDYVVRSEEYLAWLGMSSGRVRIITLVRDPVARNLSAMFESWDTHPPDWREEDDREDLARLFVETFDKSVLRWFDDEIMALTGIDVLAKPFDRATRSIRIAAGRFDILLLRAEDDDLAKQSAVRRFVEDETIEIFRRNVSNQKPRGALYRTLVDTVRLPETLCREVYAARFVGACYDSAEIEAFWRKRSFDEPR